MNYIIINFDDVICGFFEFVGGFELVLSQHRDGVTKGGDLDDKIFTTRSKKGLDENMVCSLFLTDSKLQFCKLRVL